MNKEMLDLAASSVKAANSAGADDCRVRIGRERFVEVSYRGRKPENIKESATKSLTIEVFANGRYSGQTTSDLRKDALASFISNAVATTKLLAQDPFRMLPDPKYYAGRAQMDLQIVDPDYAKLTPGERHALVKTIEDACLAEGGNKVISVSATGYDGTRESVTLTSNGFEGYRQSTEYETDASMTARDEGDRRPAGSFYASAVARKAMPNPEEVGRKAARRTLSLLGAKKIKTETLPIIVENQNVPRVLGPFLQGMAGRNIQQKQSFLADKKGQKVGSAQFTLIDDPFVPGGLGSRLYDGDGFAAKKRVMVDAGVLNDFFIDWYYSRKLGWEPTTAGPSNLVIPPGKRSVDEIMKDVGRGIFITGFIGGNANSTTGDSSIGIFGQLFENGQLTQPVAEMNIADNHLKFWHKLAEAANDPWMYSTQRTPSLVFTDVVVSGI